MSAWARRACDVGLPHALVEEHAGGVALDQLAHGLGEERRPGLGFLVELVEDMGRLGRWTGVTLRRARCRATGLGDNALHDAAADCRPPDSIRHPMAEPRPERRLRQEQPPGQPGAELHAARRSRCTAAASSARPGLALRSVAAAASPARARPSMCATWGWCLRALLFVHVTLAVGVTFRFGRPQGLADAGGRGGQHGLAGGAAVAGGGLPAQAHAGALLAGRRSGWRRWAWAP